MCGDAVTSDVRLSLDDRVVFGRASIATAAGPVSLQLQPQIRKYPVANCTPIQWQFPYDMQSDPACWNWYAPRPRANESSDFVLLRHDATKRLAVVGDVHSSAIAVVVLSQQTSNFSAMQVVPGGVTYSWSSGGPLVVEYAVVLGDSADLSLLVSKALGIAADFSSNFEGAIDSRQQQFADALTPNNARYSGHLPLLDTAENATARVYYMSVLSVLANERVGLPYARCGAGRVWVTGGAENCTTNSFFWDNAFASTMLAMLDPATFKCMLQSFYRQSVGGYDPAAGWGIDWQTGHSVGAWYAANDMSLFKMAVYYVAVSGDFGFLNETIDGVVVLDQLATFATYWKTLRTAGQSLADYGLAHNLLECVPSYIHCVASFNAANVWMMRMLSRVFSERGDTTRAQQLTSDAQELAAAVLTLYVPGQGFWNALYPNGTKVPVRHVIDLVYVSEFMAADLPPSTASEMTSFGLRELVTPQWMRAQSLLDLYANFSDRTDHGPYGAYDGWPSALVAALARQGSVAQAEAFLRQTADVVRLGPYGQAHGVHPPQAPYKPFEFTLFNALCGGGFADVIITTVLGLQPDQASLTSTSPPALLLPNVARTINATLHSVSWQGSTWTARSGAAGLIWTRESGPRKSH